MKLLSCNIRAFGGFTDRSFSFTDGVNCFLENNGYGKSTLAAFIRAMFYGMDSYKGNARGFPDRMHYYPAGTSRRSTDFGGSLTFEKDCNTYRIERFFDEKSETRDTLTVYRNGAVTGELGENPGLALFGIDAESFERTVFFDGNSVATGTTPDINRALNNVIGTLSTEVTADSAAKALESAANKIRGKQRGKGLAAEAEKELALTRDRILNLRKTEDSLGEKYEQRKKLQTEASALAEKSKEYAKYSELAGKVRVYEEKEKAVRENEDAIAAIEEKYPNGIPGKEITDRLRDCAETAYGIDEDSRRLYADIVIDDSEFERVSKAVDCIAAYEKTSADERTRWSVNITEYENLKKFVWNPGLYKKVPALEKLEEQLKENDVKIRTRAVRGSNYKRGRENFLTKFGLSVGSCSAVLCFIATLLRKFSDKLPFLKIVPWVFLGAFALSALSALAGYLLDKQKEKRYAADYRREGAELAKERNTILLKMKEVLGDYAFPFRRMPEKSVEGPDEEPDAETLEVPELVTSFKADCRRFFELDEIRKKTDKIIEDAEYKELKFSESVADFFAPFGLDANKAYAADMKAALEDIKRRYGAYCRFRDAEKAALELLERFGLEKPGNWGAFASAIDSDRENCSVLRSNLEKKRNDARDYKEKECPEGLPAAPGPEYEALEEKTESLRRDIAALDRTIEACEDEIAAIPGYEQKEAELGEKIKTLDEERRIFLLAAAEIKAADRRIKDRYISPVRDRLRAYLGSDSGFEENRLSLDGNYAVSVDLGGALRDDRYLSEGQKELISFCQRLALCDNVFKSEKPFLILDDPFASLDSVRLGKMLELVKRLGAERQILYFCCHESRRI